MTVNIHEAKTQFSKLVKRACDTETVIIANAGVPIIQLIPIYTKRKERIPGTAKNKITILDTFDDPLLNNRHGNGNLRPPILITYNHRLTAM